MTYEETLHYLYTSIPVFQHTGASAYKPGLGTSIALDDHLENPHRTYRSIHVAGTNGKGSVSHLLAAVLQQAGYKIGLYTSPHLIDFRERIRVDGQMIPRQYVIDFVERHRLFFSPLRPSFFELTSGMAFDYFRTEKVDFAIIETGLGGRLDSTNIITPILSIITNISPDHTQFLGDTIEKIAIEKAGIIKKGVPVLIGETDQQSVAEVFSRTAEQTNAPLYFASQMDTIGTYRLSEEEKWMIETKDFGVIQDELGGSVQINNAQTVLAALRLLSRQGIEIPEKAVQTGFEHVTSLTGLMGRWQVIQENPKIVCDTGHNIGGWKYLQQQLNKEAGRHKQLRMVVGMVNDKDINGVLRLMPRNARYYFTQASIQRALPASDFATVAAVHGLSGGSYNSVKEAVNQALRDADQEDMIFIGGSSFIVADALSLFYKPENK